VSYLGVNALIAEINDPDFVVLGIPCNNFGLQEPGMNSEIMNGINAVRPGNGYVPNFELTNKVDVNGDNEHPLYTFLKAGCPNPTLSFGDGSRLYWSPIKQTDINWNFEKFLINRAGKADSRYAPHMEPMLLADRVRQLLADNPAPSRGH
jgi:glutathione peroxidase